MPTKSEDICLSTSGDHELSVDSPSAPLETLASVGSPATSLTSEVPVSRLFAWTSCLLRFLQDRLQEDVELIIGNTPLFGPDVRDPQFEERFLDRGNLLRRTQDELAVIALIIEAMRKEQGSPPEPEEQFVSGPVTDLGSEVLKTLAAKYAGLPEFNSDWHPSRHLEAP